MKIHFRYEICFFRCAKTANIFFIRRNWNVWHYTTVTHKFLQRVMLVNYCTMWEWYICIFDTFICISKMKSIWLELVLAKIKVAKQYTNVPKRWFFIHFIEIEIYQVASRCVVLLYCVPLSIPIYVSLSYPFNRKSM